jgi:hypothetical protein
LIDHHQNIDPAISSPARLCGAGQLTKLACQINQACTAASQHCSNVVNGTWLATHGEGSSHTEG